MTSLQPDPDPEPATEPIPLPRAVPATTRESELPGVSCRVELLVELASYAAAAFALYQIFTDRETSLVIDITLALVFVSLSVLVAWCGRTYRRTRRCRAARR